MALHVVEAPAGTGESARLYIAHMKGGQGFRTRSTLAQSSGEPLWLTAPHPVFNLALDDVRPQGTFESARMTGWRYLVISKRLAVGTVELAAEEPTDPPRFSRITDGRIAESVARTLIKAERSAVVRRRNYTLGMLRVPEIRVHALWLRDNDADGLHDLFGTVMPIPRGVPRERILTAAQFMRILIKVRHYLSAGAKVKNQPV